MSAIGGRPRCVKTFVVHCLRDELPPAIRPARPKNRNIHFDTRPSTASETLQTSPRQKVRSRAQVRLHSLPRKRPAIRLHPFRIGNPPETPVSEHPASKHPDAEQFRP